MPRSTIHWISECFLLQRNLFDQIISLLVTTISSMASSDVLPRFFSIFISQYSSDSLAIPRSYYEHLPRRLPKTVILMGAGGKVWKVAMMSKRDQVYLEQGWGNFVMENELKDGEFLAFVFDGQQSFEVSIYGRGNCKETRAAIEVQDISDGTKSDTDSLHSINIVDDDETESISGNSPDNTDTTSVFDEADEVVNTTTRSRRSSREK